MSEWYIDNTKFDMDDYHRVIALEQEIFGPEAWSPTTLMNDISGELRRYFFARRKEDGLIIGYAGVQYAGTADVTTIAVEKEWRRQGIARALMEKLEEASFDLYEEFGDETPPQLLLEVRQSNEVAQQLYKSLGYSVIDTVPRYYHHPLETAVIMRKRLGRGNKIGASRKLASYPPQAS